MSRPRACLPAAGIALLALHGAFAAGTDVDPTRPPAALIEPPRTEPIPKEVTEYRLSAVRTLAGARWAIVNGERVVRGDPVGPATVHDIGPDWVTLEYEHQQVTLRLHRVQVKTLAGNPASRGAPR